MKQIILSLIMVIACFGFAKADVEINETNFPDPGFRNWIMTNVPGADDGLLSDTEIADVKEIFINSGSDIYNINGINLFTKLENLKVWNIGFLSIAITDIDLTENKKLKSFVFKLGAYNSQDSAPKPLNSLKINGLPDLETISIASPGFPELDCSYCPNLKSISATNGKLTSLKLDQCYSLQSLDCQGNQFSTFSLSGFQHLESLNLENNSIISLTINECNALPKIDCSNGVLSVLNIANCTELQFIDCSHNNLKKVIFGNLPMLTELNCSHNNLRTLDCSQYPELSHIDFSYCQQFETFPTLPSGINSIVCSNSPIIAKADLSLYPELNKLHADSCSLTVFDATKCPNVYSLHLTGNHIMALDLNPLKSIIDKRLRQSINMPARRLKSWGTDGYDLWEITMPVDFDRDRVSMCTGLRLYGTGTRGDTGTETHVTPIRFTDTDGMPRICFRTDNIIGDSSKGLGGFYYEYDVKSNSNITLGVHVFGHQVSSGIEDIANEKVVSGVRYFDLQGHEGAEPFSGFNIEVTHYTDGTSQSKKFIR